MSIFGAPTVAELRDLLKAKDYTLNQLTTAWVTFLPQWAQTDLAGMQDYQSDFDALTARYKKARAKAQTLIDGAAAHGGVSDTLITAIPEWNGVLTALNPEWQTNGRPKGSLQDLDQRLQAERGKKVDYSQMPQPNPKSDADLNLYKQADMALRTVGVLPPSPGQFPWARILIGAAVGAAGSAAVLPAMMIKAATGGALIGWLSTKPWSKYLKP